MNKIRLFTGVFAALLTSSCASGDASTNDSSLEATGSKKASKKELMTSDCLEMFDYDYCGMVTIQDIQKHHTIDLSTIEKKDGGIKGEYGSVLYTWASDRPDQDVKVSPMSISVPDLNTVGIKRLTFYDDGSAQTVESFSIGYRGFSEEELATMNSDLESRYSDPEELESAKSLLKIRANMDFELVEDLGTRAYWKWGEQYGGELITLVGRSSFTIVSKISDDAHQNLELAKKLAREVINKCN
ncbi:MAG TPA: hypothetical protein VKZ95_01040 [Sphingobacteriaceae bacterium]|nr:hypothetical protein [Sphingobacteriaceae bacterium]